MEPRIQSDNVAQPIEAAQAQPPSPLLPPHLRLSPAELVALGEAPIKPQFIRSPGARLRVGAVTGSLGLPGTATAAAAAAAAAAGDERQDGAGEPPNHKSKRQVKRERAQKKYSSAELCFAFTQGKCSFGEGCRCV